MTVTLPAIRMLNQVGRNVKPQSTWCNHRQQPLLVPSYCILIQSHFCKSLSVVQNKTFSQLSHRKTFFHAHIHACLHYGATLWDLACVSTLKPLVSLHSRALKLKSTSLTDEDFKTLCILPVKLRFELNKRTFMHKSMFESAQLYLRQLSQVNRSKGLNKITITIPRIDLFKSSLTYSGAVLWNLLSESFVVVVVLVLHYVYLIPRKQISNPSKC